MRLHASREARRRYGLGDFAVGEDGALVVPSARHARILAARVRDVRETAGTAWREVRAGQIVALALINEIFHRVIALYRQERLPALDAALTRALEQGGGRPALDALLRRQAEEFPPRAVAEGGDPAAFFAPDGAWPGRRPALLAELLVLWLANRNPACEPLADLFDDEPLRRYPEFAALLAAVERFFEGSPPLGPPFVPGDERLLALLRMPARVEPYSLPGQLRYIQQHWSLLLERIGLTSAVLSSLDLDLEEEQAFRLPPGWNAPTRSEVPDLRGLASEEERFSPDSDWMPQVVLIARNAHVWLAQLSRRHGRAIERLDEIPDAELERLARWGITGLWLIGLWERSEASRRIKQMRGNPDAAASAYSIREYAIASDLGGEPAWRDLRERALRVGIRLASDMVPNHMGIDSEWMLRHPDRFLSLPESPYPSYRFDGADLSPDPGTGIFLEDHYADASDAAVVFRRLDRASGQDRFVYHGNDGTSMPWNDTAQLDYLNPETREAVIRTILAVAERFPIIRFDAAMTLAKRHYQRLWFPEPGSGGAVPSRAEHGMTRAEFDARMPREFWREVVDRVTAEAPGTLLLAEAFWFMEGYFVRTLGMHRVYNSAFMNMLRDEENAKYRLVLRNTIEFDPEILGRYVNFMSNPDERTAIEQFGDGDKYFGLATLMATLPGLPMFGHGQIEGLTERYGMEFRRPFRDEEPNRELIRRHEAEIAPLLARRSLFAGSREFLLFDLFTDAGAVDENVFAYSNRLGSDAALIVYHNRFAETSGWIRESAAFAARQPDGSRRLERHALADGLGLAEVESDAFVVFRDHVGGLDHIRPVWELREKGLRVTLAAYGRHVFLDFRPVADAPGRPWSRLAGQLAGAGTPDAERALRDLVLGEIRDPFAAVAGRGALRRLLDPLKPGTPVTEGPEEIRGHLSAFFRAAVEAAAVREGAARHTPSPDDARAVIERLRGLARLRDAARDPSRSALDPARHRGDVRPARPVRSPSAIEGLAGINQPAVAGGLAGREVLAGLLPLVATARSLAREWGLVEILEDGLRDAGADEAAARHAAAGALALLPHGQWFHAPSGLRPARRAGFVVSRLLDDPAVAEWLGINTFEGVTWFHRESFETLLDWLAALAALDAAHSDPERHARSIAERSTLLETLRDALERSGNRVDRLRAELATPRRPRRPRQPVR